jgi:hypothetical protein
MAKGTKGQHCTRWKRVRVKGQGMSKRCANFAKGSGLGRARRRRKRSR